MPIPYLQLLLSKFVLFFQRETMFPSLFSMKGTENRSLSEVFQTDFDRHNTTYFLTSI